MIYVSRFIFIFRIYFNVYQTYLFDTLQVQATTANINMLPISGFYYCELLGLFVSISIHPYHNNSNSHFYIVIVFLCIFFFSFFFLLFSFFAISLSCGLVFFGGVVKMSMLFLTCKMFISFSSFFS